MMKALRQQCTKCMNLSFNHKVSRSYTEPVYMNIFSLCSFDIHYDDELQYCGLFACLELCVLYREDFLHTYKSISDTWILLGHIVLYQCKSSHVPLSILIWCPSWSWQMWVRQSWSKHELRAAQLTARFSSDKHTSLIRQYCYKHPAVSFQSLICTNLCIVYPRIVNYLPFAQHCSWSIRQ